MGADPTMSGRRGDCRTVAVEATVVELLPRATFRVQLDDRRLVLASPASATRVNFVRLRAGDRVMVELAPHDPTRGKIVKLLRAL